MPSFTEHSLNNKIYVDLKELLPLRPYGTGCKSLTQLIRKYQYNDVINGQVKNNILIQTEKRSFKHGSVFVSKTEIIDLFSNDTSAIVEYPPAPPILEDSDLVFFKDDDGNEHSVLMRGERTRQGIYFKVKDVERVFEMKRVSEIIQSPETIYTIVNHYKWFTIAKHNEVGNGRSKELYLTYSGLKHMIEASQSGIGYKFKNWIDEIVFAAAFGTVEQKAATFARALNVDADHLTAVMNKTDGEISCLYLIDIKRKKEERRVFKYGYTKHLRSRFKDHMRKYGDNIELIKFAFVPEMNLSQAEAQIRAITKPLVYECGDEKELIALNENELESVLLTYKSVADIHCGKLRELVGKYESDINTLHSTYKLEIAELKHECSNKVHAAEVAALIASKDLEVLQMKVQMLEAQLKSASL
jgi:hypothetical protein